MVVAIAVLRRAFHLEEVLTIKHFNYMRKLLIGLTLVWFYFMVAEYLTTFYGYEVEEMRVFWEKFTGTYAIPFWIMATFCFVIPMAIFLTKGKRSIGWMVTAGLVINVGMWLERYVVIVPTLVRSRLLSTHDDAAILQAIAEGSPPDMPAFAQALGGSLSWEEILNLVAFVRSWGPVAPPPEMPSFYTTAAPPLLHCTTATPRITVTIPIICTGVNRSPSKTQARKAVPRGERLSRTFISRAVSTFKE